MKIRNRYVYQNDAPPEYLESLAEHQIRDLMVRLATEIEKDRWYSIKLTDINYESDVSEFPFTTTKRMQIEVEPIREKRMVWVSQEEIHLNQYDKPFLQKMKNCFRYLKDRTGGRWEEREVDK